VTVEGVTWRLADGRRVGGLRRRGEGPVCVLLHGASGNAETWRPLLERWNDGRLTWVALDLPGRGASDGPPCRTVDDAARWIHDAVRAGLPAQPWLIGHSLGGGVALSVSLDADRAAAFAGFMLVSSSARLKVAPAILEAVEAATDAEPFRLDLGFGSRTPSTVISAYANQARPTPAAASTADWHACDGFDVRARVGAARGPVHLIWGSEDQLTPPRHQVALLDALPGGRGVEIEGVGHMLPWEAPDEFRAQVDDALGSAATRCP